ncbi:MAG: hypothetical protein HYV26_16935 [Candidatus Hydrogenedentes bacterium]|nr:hypothetical protein [Candidatus Hydrogenedentota bacterium]
MLTSVSGTGAIEVVPADPSLPMDPENRFPAGTVLHVWAKPEPGWDFMQWSGDLSGFDSPMELTLSGDLAITASFIQVPEVPEEFVWDPFLLKGLPPGSSLQTPDSFPKGGPYVLTTQTAGIGYGSVVRDPDQSTYTEGQLVNLTAVPDSGSSFVRWDGDFFMGFMDDFSDGNHTSNPYWSKSGTWSAADYEMTNTVLSSGAQSFYQMIDNTDFDLQFRYRLKSEGTATPQICALQLRDYTSDGHRVYLYFQEDLAWLRERTGTSPNYVYTTLVMNTAADSFEDTNYYAELITDGNHLEVWRYTIPLAPVQILTTDNATVFAGNVLAFLVWPNSMAAYDDIVYTTPAASSIIMDSD